MTSSLENHLRALRPDGLADLMARRPEVLGRPREVRTLGTLAQWLDRRDSAWRALAQLDSGIISVAEALAGLGKLVHRDELADLLREPGAVETAVVDDALVRLGELALAWETDPGLWQTSGGLRGCFPRPLGLGPPLHVVLPRLSDHDLTAVARNLDVPATTSRASNVAAVEARLRDEDLVNTIALGAPREVSDTLVSLALKGDLRGLATTFPESVDVDGRIDIGDPRPVEVLSWLTSVGFLAFHDSLGYVMPREVAVTLRGKGWYPVVARPPVVPSVAVHADAVRRQSSSAATTLLQTVTSLVDELGARPTVTLRDGGVGIREVRRLAKTVNRETDEIELALTLAAACDLLDLNRGTVVPSTTAAQWRQRDPAGQLADLLGAWWDADAGATYRRDGYSGKQQPVLGWGGGVPARVLRQQLVAALESLPAGQGTTGVDAVRPAAVWARPLGVAQGTVGEALAAALWREAELTGVVAVDTLSPLGRALAAGGRTELLEQCAALLPAVSRTAVFQSDLTVMVHGVCNAALADLLNLCADLENRGASNVWRLSPTSVRRAMDAGVAAESLLDRLSGVSDKPLPQPVTYLVRDVGRRHGHVRVASLASAVLVDDEALLAEIQHHRRLSALQLRRLTPGVLASQKGTTEVVAALRGAGYMPVALSADGSVAVQRVEAPRPSPAPLGPSLERFGRQLRDDVASERAAAAVELATRLLGRG